MKLPKGAASPPGMMGMTGNDRMTELYLIHTVDTVRN